ncbi:MAG: hypothetical protein SFW36_18400 [Leptolyngbyaceae cyanobacterium bins.59]|nr:hypothetical protein [Leptolyngbyaceae cyanobacterium bins.59]
MSRMIGLSLGGLILTLPTLFSLPPSASSQTEAPPLFGTIAPRREVIFYPSASSSLTIPDANSPATVTLSLVRVPEGLNLQVNSASLPADRCALVSLQVPSSITVDNRTYEVPAAPVSLVPLTTRPGFCGAISTYRKTYVSQAQPGYSVLYRLTPSSPAGITKNLDFPAIDSGKVRLPFTVEVFFVPVRDQ